MVKHTEGLRRVIFLVLLFSEKFVGVEIADKVKTWFIWEG
jgi:hypothetical protein